MLEAFAVALAGTLAAQISPGPNLMAVASVGLAQGRWLALCVVFGVASGVLIWAAGVALGLGAVVEAYPLSLVALQIVGGSYLLYLGLKALAAAARGTAVSIRLERERLGPVSAWRRGLLVVLTNPKAALMWAAVATYLFGAGLPGWQVALFGPVGAASALLVYGVYAFIFSHSRVVAAYDRVTGVVEAVFGLAFSAIGGQVLWDGIKAARA
ncbi:MAG: LysE family translocator [Pseudomonadota bacterium]